MRLPALALLCFSSIGCKSQPPPAAPPPPERLEPLHPEVLRHRAAALPDLAKGDGHGGVALNDYGQKRGEPQIRPERVVIVPDGPGPVLPPTDLDPQRDADTHFLQGYQLRESQPMAAARHFAIALRLAAGSNPTSAKARNELAKIGPSIKSDVKELILRAYQLKADNPTLAEEAFREVSDVSAESQELYEFHERAEAQLAKLKH